MGGGHLARGPYERGRAPDLRRSTRRWTGGPWRVGLDRAGAAPRTSARSERPPDAPDVDENLFE